jgi:transketolase
MNCKWRVTVIDAGVFRKEILNLLIPYFHEDKRYYLLICDMGFGVADKIKAEFPGRVVNCGIMEQATIGIAAGMSMTGLIPIVYSIVNFLVFRAFEQIRNDIMLQGLNVKLIATGVNDYFKSLGPSHCCGHDDIEIIKLINMDIYDPYSDNKTFRRIVRQWMRSKKAGYMRV